MKVLRQTEKKSNKTPAVSFQRVSNSEKETFHFGRTFASQLGPGEVVALFGEMGSGKTTCIQGICSGLDVQAEVTSPTFTLINEYQGATPVHHFDFYRLHSQAELIDLGLEEYFYGSGICLIEWPALVLSLLPARHFEIHMQWPIEEGYQNRRHLTVYRYP